MASLLTNMSSLSRPSQHALASSKTAELARSLAEWQALQNRTAPINQLPNELVVEVLSYLPQAKYDMTWIPVIAICRYWRAVALATPKLWAKIPVTVARGIPFLRVFLNRSRDVNITIIIYRNVKFDVAQLRMLSHRKASIVSLELPVHETQEGNDFSAAFDFPMPKLESLTLMSQSIIRLDPTVKDFPRLRSLDLERVHIPWDSPPFSALVSLRLVGIDWVLRVQMSQFFNILEACPDLESLQVVECALAVTRMASLRTIALPRLRTLLLEGMPPYAISAHLKPLELPVGCAIFLESIDDDEDDYGDDPAATAGRIAGDIAMVLDEHTVRLLRPLSEANYLEVSIIGDCFTVEAGIDTTDTACANVLFRLRMQFNAPFHDMAEHLGDVLLPLSRTLAASPLTSLRIMGGRDAISAVDWWIVFGRIPRLERLAVGCIMDPSTCLKALCTPPVHGSDVLVCPHLRELSVKEIERGCMDSFVECITARAAQGLPLALLRLGHEFPDDFPDAEIAALGVHVVRVEWKEM